MATCFHILFYGQLYTFHEYNSHIQHRILPNTDIEYNVAQYRCTIQNYVTAKLNAERNQLRRKTGNTIHFVDFRVTSSIYSLATNGKFGQIKQTPSIDCSAVMFALFMAILILFIEQTDVVCFHFPFVRCHVSNQLENWFPTFLM